MEVEGGGRHLAGGARHQGVLRQLVGELWVGGTDGTPNSVVELGGGGDGEGQLRGGEDRHLVQVHHRHAHWGAAEEGGWGGRGSRVR